MVLHPRRNHYVSHGQPMAESREHRRLVRCLVRQMRASGIDVIRAAAPGWRIPPLVGGRRPDVFGYYVIGAAVAAGEAKRGPELRSSRAQLAEIAAALPLYGPKGAGALL